MAWKATGRPAVHQQRDRWVVRVEGLDTATGKRRPKQLGSYSSQRAARTAASKATEEGYDPSSRRTVGELVEGWVSRRLDVGAKTREQYRWAAEHIKKGLGAIAADDLERDDVADWLERLAGGGDLGRRSIQIVRMVLRAALDDAVKARELRRNPAESVPAPQRWSRATSRKRWSCFPSHASVSFGLTFRVTVRGEGKNQRSRRRIPLDPNMKRVLKRHRDLQAIERAAAEGAWEDHDLVVATQAGRPVNPRNYNQTLDRLVTRAKVPRLTSHGLRHTAATHMVANAADLGEVRAAAEILGHSPEMLMKTYSHALPASLRAVTAKIGRRAERDFR